jgi:hypothetical protein
MLACFELVEKLRAGLSLFTSHLSEVPEFSPIKATAGLAVGKRTHGGNPEQR